MAGGVAQHARAVRIVKGQDFQLVVARNGGDQRNDLAVQAGGQRLLLQLLGQLAGDVQRVHAVLEFTDLTLEVQLHDVSLSFPKYTKARPRKGTS